MKTLYGIINHNDEYINHEYSTLTGAKIGATKLGYTKIGKRVDYNIVKTWIKNPNWMEENN